MRIAAYIMRAMLAGSIAQGSNLGLFITDQILFGIGFFALLYSAFNLVLDRFVVISLLVHCYVHPFTQGPHSRR